MSAPLLWATVYKEHMTWRQFTSKSTEFLRSSGGLHVEAWLLPQRLRMFSLKCTLVTVSGSNRQSESLESLRFSKHRDTPSWSTGMNTVVIYRDKRHRDLQGEKLSWLSGRNAVGSTRKNIVVTYIYREEHRRHLQGEMPSWSLKIEIAV